MLKIALFTSDSYRHKYIARQLAQSFDLKLILTEKKSRKIKQTSQLSVEDKVFVDRHFKAREKVERQFFAAYDFPQRATYVSLEHGTINSEEVADLLQKTAPDYIILFGTSIIKKKILNLFPNRFINLHLGLSPYYKGSATNIFPYLYNEPECVGATIHIATAEVDAGGILHQLRPDISLEDSLHSIGNKVILKAGKELASIISTYDTSQSVPVEQKGKGRICRIQDFSPGVLRQIYAFFDGEGLKEYLNNKGQRDSLKPIVTVKEE
ncbi:MAG: hypothetical protein CL868_01525 [Cytophagaceae bacterium]|nr:hypothetical protein [Cytophagaceae bacterium]|tara:strand:- start:139 stop:939 length:801 start_codon:yes stop_codon:yes gene_type:complete